MRVGGLLLLATMQCAVLASAPVAWAQETPPEETDNPDFIEDDAELGVEDDSDVADESDAADPPAEPAVTPPDPKPTPELPDEPPTKTKVRQLPTLPGAVRPVAPATATGAPTSPTSTAKKPPEPRPQNTKRAPVPKIPSAPIVQEVPVATEAQLGAELEKRAMLVRAGDFRAADQELASLIRNAKVIGARNVIVASAALVSEVSTAIEAEQHDRALRLADAAIQLAPDLGAAHWAKVRAITAQNPFQVASIVRASAGLVGAGFRNFRNIMALTSRALLALLCALGATILVFTIIQLVKYLRYAGHDASMMGPEFVGASEMVLVFILLLCLPVVFRLGPVVSVALAMMFVIPYQSTRERRITVGAGALLVLAPVAIFFATPFLTFHGSLTDSMTSAMTEAFADEAVARIERGFDGKNEDPTSAIVLAKLRRQRGDLEGAEAAYRQALAVSPGNAVARTNLGTVQYLRGYAEAAQTSFQQAGTSLAQPLLNLSAIAADKGDFEQAKRFLAQARTINSDLTQRFTKIPTGVPTGEKLQEATVDEGILWSRLYVLDTEKGLQFLTEVWSPLGGALPPWATSLLVAAFVIFGLLISRRSVTLSIPCPKCGTPADRHAPAQYCGQCQSVFLAAAAVEPDRRRRKEAQVRSFQRRRRWLERLLALIAGAGHILMGEAVRGVLLLFLFMALLGSVAVTIWAPLHAWHVWAEPPTHFFWVIVAGSLLSILTLVSVRRAVAGR